MALYEFIMIIRQDVSSSDVDKIVADMSKIVKETSKGNVLKSEYWGLRQLAYEIENNKKGHYYLLGIEADNDTLKELQRIVKLSESIIRTSLIGTDEISKEPSLILQQDSEETNSVDVTSRRRTA